MHFLVNISMISAVVCSCEDWGQLWGCTRTLPSICHLTLCMTAVVLGAGNWLLTVISSSDEPFLQNVLNYLEMAEWTNTTRQYGNSLSILLSLPYSMYGTVNHSSGGSSLCIFETFLPLHLFACMQSMTL